MSGSEGTYQKIRRFLEHDLWEVEVAGQGRLRRFLVHQGQIVVLVVRDFIADSCMLKASALTFTTLPSIVPRFPANRADR